MTSTTPYAAQPAVRVDARQAAQSTPAEARQRFRDGLVGFTIAAFAAHHAFLKYLMLWELQSRAK